MYRHADRSGRRGQDLSGAGGPEPAGDLRGAHAGGVGGEGPHGAVRDLAAGRVAAPRRAEGGRTGDRSARGAVRLLSGGAGWVEAAGRLDRALSRLLDGACRTAGETAGGNGRMTLTDRTAPSQTETLALEFDLK